MSMIGSAFRSLLLVVLLCVRVFGFKDAGQSRYLCMRTLLLLLLLNACHSLI